MKFHVFTITFMLLKGCFVPLRKLLNRGVKPLFVHHCSSQYSQLLEKIADPARANDIALIESSKNVFVTYKELDNYSSLLAKSMKDKAVSPTIGAFNKPSISFVVSLLATWKLKKTFVPLCVTHSVGELNYFIEDSGIQLVACGFKTDIEKDTLSVLKPTIFETHSLLHSPALPTSIDTATTPENENALIMYTSGTTGRPKGVVHTHDSLLHMVKALQESWQYTAEDKILHFLPLYHLHGMLNKLLCMLYVGGTVEFLPSAQASVIWDRLVTEQTQQQTHAKQPQQQSSNSKTHKTLSLFMAVPTVYAKLLEHSKTLSEEERKAGVQTMQSMRLMVSGSAALPDVIMDAWYTLTGQRLLERYGMTELGMALSNPYLPATARKKGFVGHPMRYVTVRLVEETTGQVITTPNTPGELQVSGPCVFKEYLNRPDATKESFVEGKWFKTGDIAEVSSSSSTPETNGYYKILGRSSSDIIKASGYKISALEIERELLSHPEILEAAVVGKPDVNLGEIIIAVIAVRTVDTPTLSSSSVKAVLTEYLHDKLAKYKTPRVYHIVQAIPRNHLGKVNKKALLKDLQL